MNSFPIFTWDTLSFQIFSESRQSPEQFFSSILARSFVWKYFKRIGRSEVRCSMCGKSFKYNNGATSSFKYHLKSIHEIIGWIHYLFIDQDTFQVSNLCLSPNRFLHLKKSFDCNFILGRSYSFVWKYFNRLGLGTAQDTASCSICGREFKYGNQTTSLRYHLKKVHSIIGWFVNAFENKLSKCSKFQEVFVVFLSS